MKWIRVRTLVIAWLGLLVLPLRVDAQCPISPDTANIITRYFHSSLDFVTDIDRAAVSRALSFVEKGGTETVQIFERLVNDLKGTALTDVDGIANVRHLVEAISTAENELQARAYLRSLNRFWPVRTQGISLADPFGNGATSNIRRVAGGNLGEMFEMAAANWLVENGYYGAETFVAFGRRVRLADPIAGELNGAFAEADHLIESGGRILSDSKYTARADLELGFANFSESQVRKWARGLRDRDFVQVIVPSSGNPRPNTLVRIAEIFEEEGASESLSRVRFFAVAVPGF